MISPVLCTKSAQPTNASCSTWEGKARCRFTPFDHQHCMFNLTKNAHTEHCLNTILNNWSWPILILIIKWNEHLKYINVTISFGSISLYEFSTVLFAFERIMKLFWLYARMRRACSISTFHTYHIPEHSSVVFYAILTDSSEDDLDMGERFSAVN